jgi:aminoglycoside phosphotransferase (APT) family kinase protein
MQREFRVIDALWPTPVPVPEPLAFCSDAEVTGAPFYAMGVVEGRSLYTPEDVETFIALERRRDLGLSFIDVLAELHLLDPVEIGLGELGKADSYVLRQLRRWYASWNASKTAERPAVDDLHEFFVANAPQQGPVRVVHGDYGLHNCISSPDGFIAAVVDWEISTLGDPLADLAYALNAWAEPGESVGPAVNRPTTMPGFPRRDELLARYVERSGADVSSIAYYSAFNHWKTAAIIEGVYARYLKGQKSSEGVDLEALCFSRDRALEQAVVKAIELGYSGSNS